MNLEKMLQLSGIEIVEAVEFGPMPTDVAGAEMELDGVIKQLEAAKRGLGLANKLRDPSAQRKHKGAVLGNLNRIRARIANIEKMLAAEQGM